MKQITNSIMMIKPVGFRYNEQTAANNYYQQVLDNLSDEKAQEKALNEFNTFVDKLRKVGVNVVVIEDTEYPDTPDSIFPNNWVSFHSNAMIGLYPMCAENRRDERREDIFDTLVDEYGFTIEGVKDFTEFEEHEKYLEGTGSMVLDHVNMIWNPNHRRGLPKAAPTNDFGRGRPEAAPQFCQNLKGKSCLNCPRSSCDIFLQISPQLSSHF